MREEWLDLTNVDEAWLDAVEASPGMALGGGRDRLSSADFEAAVARLAARAGMTGYEDVVLIETMGRHAGWLAAATTCARSKPHDAPHLVLVPEQSFDETRRAGHIPSGEWHLPPRTAILSARMYP
jgi:hypothetical protein